MISSYGSLSGPPPLYALKEIVTDVYSSKEVQDETTYIYSETSYKWEEANWSDLQSGNMLISFVPLDFRAFSNSDWTTFQASCLEDAVFLTKYFKGNGKEINNLIVLSHGASDHLNLGNTVELSDFKNDNFIANDFNTMLNSITPGGSVLFTGCGAGEQFGSGLGSYVRNDINIYMYLSTYTSPANSINGELYAYIFLNSTQAWILNPPVINVSTGIKYSDIWIGRDGSLIPKK
jgi:hypothetical protein